jgi:glycosyltransferase involved in cell wall biosynthesis
VSSVPHLLHVFSTFVPAGPEVRTVRLINALGSKYRHTIVAMDGRTDARELLSKDVDVRLLDPPPRAGSVRTVLALRKLLKQTAPDLLLTYNWGAFDAVMAARSRGFKNVVHHEDGFTPDELDGFVERRVKARRFFLPGVAVVIVPSKNLRNIAVTHWKLELDQVKHVANGVDLAAFSRRDGNPTLRQKLEIPGAAPVVGGVGHLRPEKNYARLLHACENLCKDHGAHVVLLGEGPERPSLEKLAARPPLAGRVHLVGHQSSTAEWYRMFDLFCISSDTEQMPVSLLEAMASELPIASTEVGDIRNVLPGEQAGGLVVLEEDETVTVRNLGRALERFLEDPEETRQLARGNRERVVETYSFEIMLAAYEALWKRGLEA